MVYYRHNSLLTMPQWREPGASSRTHGWPSFSAPTLTRNDKLDAQVPGIKAAIDWVRTLNGDIGDRFARACARRPLYPIPDNGPCTRLYRRAPAVSINHRTLTIPGQYAQYRVVAHSSYYHAGTNFCAIIHKKRTEIYVTNANHQLD